LNFKQAALQGRQGGKERDGDYNTPADPHPHPHRCPPVASFSLLRRIPQDKEIEFLHHLFETPAARR